MPNVTRPCETHPDLVSFKYPLRYFSEALRYRRKVKVVAIGSSSTAGVLPVLPYPPRLEFLLRRKFEFYGRMIDVLNRGIGGQEAPEELSRLETDACTCHLADRYQRRLPQRELQSGRSRKGNRRRPRLVGRLADGRRADGPAVYASDG